MGRLIPERRADRNGRVVTRHVRADQQAQKGSLRIPAPSMPAMPRPRGTESAAAGPARSALRPKQLEQKPFVFSRSYTPPSRALGYSAQTHRSTFEFKASEVEFYDVLSVASEADALRLMSKGYRSGEEAAARLRDGGGEVLDRRELTEELLRRNVSAKGMVEARLDGFFPSRREYTLTEQADAIELYSIAALRTRDLYSEVIDEVLEGRIRVGDIKAIGATRLKVGSRLAASKALLEALASGEAKFTVEDVRWALDECTPGGTGISSQTSAAELYDTVALCLLHGGRELFDRGFEIRLVFHVRRSLSFLGLGAGPERYEAIAYDLEARAGTPIEWNSDIRVVEKLDALRRAGIPAKEAGEMVASGLTVEQAIALHGGETSAPVAEGWL